MSTLFFTGFPGFLGSELLPRLLARQPDWRAVCLAQPKYAELARRRARELESAHPETGGRIDILEGDLTLPGLGLGSVPALLDDVRAIYHLAAVYDLAVGRELATRVNVEGTRRMLDFAATCPHLDRFHYVSTCYVSGTYAGVFSEDDLDRGQRFHNFYEETKFIAEMDVQKRMRGGLPVTIYRPGIVVGDSTTGATQKYDGPYSIIRFLLRQPRIAILPVVGDLGKTEVNVVPRDFVVEAIAYLSGVPESRGTVYQLADPNPLTAEEMVGEVAHAARRRIVRVPLPLGAARLMLARVPGMQRLIGIPPATLDYFVHRGRYATGHAQAALAAGGIRCPRFSEYVEAMVGFVRAHPEVGAAAMA